MSSKKIPVLQPCATDDSFKIDYDKKINPGRIILKKGWIKKVQNENLLLYQTGTVNVTIYKNGRVILKNCKTKKLAKKILSELVKK